MQSKEKITIKEFANDISETLKKENLDVEISILKYKEYKFDFNKRKFNRTQKSLIPVMNGLGNVGFDQRESFRKFNMLLYSEYERNASLNNQELNFKLKFTPTNRCYIAGDRINHIQNLQRFNNKETFSINFAKDFYTLVIFTTPLHFNYNPDLIKKLTELESFTNLKLYLAFITDTKEDEVYNKLCEQFVNFYKFTNLKYLTFPNYETVNTQQYKLLDLNYDLNDPSKICYFINEEGLILSDFVEFTDEKLRCIKNTLQNKNDEIFMNKIKSSNRYDYKNIEKKEKNSIQIEDAKIFNKEVKNVVIDENLKDKKNNFITIQIREYFDINNNLYYTNREIEKITISYALNKKYLFIIENFMKNVKIRFILNGTTLDSREKLITTLKMIYDDISQFDLIDVIDSKSLKISFDQRFENGISKKSYSLENKINIANFISDHKLFTKLLELNKIENEVNKDKRSPDYIFKDFFLIPRLNEGETYIPLKKKHLSGVRSLNFDPNTEEVINTDSKILIYYFFVSWSGPSMAKLNFLNTLPTDKYKVIAINIDSDFEDLQENIIYNLGGFDKFKFDILFSCTQTDKSFEIYKKLYRSEGIANKLIVINESGKIVLIDSITPYKELKDLEDKINKSNTIQKNKDISKSNVKIDFNKVLSNFYKNNFSSIKYFHEFTFNICKILTVDSSFKIQNEEVESFYLNAEFRKEECDKLSKFLNDERILTNFKLNLLETTNLTQLFDKLNSQSICSICSNSIKTAHTYYCHECDNFTCDLCVLKHEHNLILALKENKNKDLFENIDTIRLGENLAFYGTIKSKNHLSGCNRCETVINNKARFICLNCNPGKVPLDTGYNDYCEDCIKLLIERWNNPNETKKMKDNSEHDFNNHIYLRLDYSVNYFGY